MFGFAVDPDDPDHIVATAPDTVVASRDGGRSWKTLTGPPVVVVSWEAGTGQWGVEGDGTVHDSADGGASWQEAGRLPGEPHAFLATGDVLYAAAHDGDATGIYQSADGGRSWELRYRDETL